MNLYIPFLKKSGMHIEGKPRYIAQNVIFDDFDKIHLSDRNVISGGCHFLTHDYSYTTAAIAVTKKEPDGDIAMVRPIQLGSNVFIGKNTLLLPGSKIGDNCIIGACSVVRGKIPPRSIYIGNPGHVIGTIDELYEKWSKVDTSILRQDTGRMK